jgi:Ser/Thr protein kinase RdoA (MazF antagonist)
VTSAEAAAEVGRALGDFLVGVRRLPGPPLREPIHGFKDFARRREDFEFVVEVDAYDRVATCQPEIEAVRSRHRLVDRLVDAIERGQLPERTVHNDAKADNVLLDDATGEALCVIDLDTVAPGTVLYDVGDLLRSATVTSSEDATDLSGLAVRDDLLVAALAGYLRGAAGELSAGELELLPLAGPLMAYENALRFLTDHMVGDTYYRITRPRQNLDRARGQLRVLEALWSARERVSDLVGPAAS